MRSLINTKHSNENINQESTTVGQGGVGRSKKHESADKHVSGEALYIDDRPSLRGQLHAAAGQSTIAHGLTLKASTYRP